MPRNPKAPSSRKKTSRMPITCCDGRSQSQQKALLHESSLNSDFLLFLFFVENVCSIEIEHCTSIQTTKNDINWLCSELKMEYINMRVLLVNFVVIHLPLNRRRRKSPWTYMLPLTNKCRQLCICDSSWLCSELWRESTEEEKEERERKKEENQNQYASATRDTSHKFAAGQSNNNTLARTGFTESS